MSSNNLRNNELEFTPTFGTQQISGQEDARDNSDLHMQRYTLYEGKGSTALRMCRYVTPILLKLFCLTQ